MSNPDALHFAVHHVVQDPVCHNLDITLFSSLPAFACGCVLEGVEFRIEFHKHPILGGHKFAKLQDFPHGAEERLVVVDKAFGTLQRPGGHLRPCRIVVILHGDVGGEIAGNTVKILSILLKQSMYSRSMLFPELVVSAKSKANEWIQWNDCTVNQILLQLEAESGISYGAKGRF